MSKKPTPEEICHAKLMATAAIVFERRPGERGLVRRYVTARERLRARRLLRIENTTRQGSLFAPTKLQQLKPGAPCWTT